MNQILDILPGFKLINSRELGALVSRIHISNGILGYECNAVAPMWAMISSLMWEANPGGPEIAQVVLSPDEQFVAIVFTNTCWTEPESGPYRVSFSVMFPLATSWSDLYRSLNQHGKHIMPIIETPVDLSQGVEGTASVFHRYDFFFPTKGLLSLDEPGKLSRTMDNKRQVVRRYRDSKRYEVLDFASVEDTLATRLWDSWVKPKDDDPDEGGVFLEAEQRFVGSTRYHDFRSRNVEMNGTILRVAGEQDYVGIATSTRVSDKCWTMFFCIQNPDHPCSGDFMWRNEATKWRDTPMEADGGGDELHGRDASGLSSFKFKYLEAAGGERKTMHVLTCSEEQRAYFQENTDGRNEHDALLREKGILPA